MKANTRINQFSMVLIIAVVFSLLGRAVVLAQGEETIVEVFPLNGNYIGIKITFPTEISGSFAGTLAGKHFDCVVVPTNVLYCMGPFRNGPDPALLTIYDQDTEEIVLREVISPPQRPGREDEPTPEPTVDPCEINPESFECLGEPQ
jgi:hypothetical protein